MARNTARSKLAATAEPPRKKRNFFSRPGANLPVLALAQAPTPQRQVSSDRVLAALQPDKAVVVAAKTFVKEKMGDDKYDTAVDTSRVTRGAIAETKHVKMRGRPRKVPIAKTTPKQYAVGSDVVTLGQRIKATTKAAAASVKSTATGITRKITLRSTEAEKAAAAAAATTESVSTSESAPETAPESEAGPSSLRSPSPEPSPVRSPSVNPSPVEDLPALDVAPPVELDVAPSVALDTAPPVPPVAPSLSDIEMPEAGPSAPPPAERTGDPNQDKVYMEAGFYCHEPQPEPDRVLINRILAERGEPIKRGRGRPRKSNVPLAPLPTVDGVISFPPLPLDFGYIQFFESEHDFSLPYNIVWESETGALDGKKRPPHYVRLRSNEYLERSKREAHPDHVAAAPCRCDPEYKCGDNCMNRVMRFICGQECPCGEECSNKSLSTRKGKGTEVVWTEARGFGLVAKEDIKAGEFVAEFTGEVMDLETFMDRKENEYTGRKDFYAMAYGHGEVIDAGMCGSDARFINHGCEPNLEVRELATFGDGFDEYEIGFFALRDIQAGEELFYDYEFDAFADANIMTAGNERVPCHCGAQTCRDFLEARPYNVSNASPVTAKRKSSTAPALAEDGTPVKRPRGRPRKHPLPDIDDPQAKRPRGRPRIHPIPDPNAPKRPRGRPRKHPLPDPNAGPKRRGRPPKVKLENGHPAAGSSRGSGSNGVVSAVTGLFRRGRGRPRTYKESSVSSTSMSDSDDWTAASSESPSFESTPEFEDGDGDVDVKPDVSSASAGAGTGTPRAIAVPQLSKKDQKAKRNGAPAGWVYVVEPVAGPSSATEEELASGRAARLAARRGT